VKSNGPRRDRSLWNAGGACDGRGAVTSNTNRESAIGEVGLKPRKSGVRYSETGV